MIKSISMKTLCMLVKNNSYVGDLKISLSIVWGFSLVNIIFFILEESDINSIHSFQMMSPLSLGYALILRPALSWTEGL